MAILTIKASTVTTSEKRAAEICSLLAEIGVEFTFTPTRNLNVRPNELLKDAMASVRAIRVIKSACEVKELDWTTTTVEQFANTVGRSDLVKLRNCGKRSIDEIIDMLHNYGFNIMI